MAQSKLIWDVTKPDKITWLRYNAKLIDHAVHRGRKSALVVGGGASTFFTHAGFAAYFGHAPQRRAPPGPAAGAGHNLANWKETTDMYGLQEGTDDESRAEFLDFVPERLLAPMLVNRSMRLRTTEFIYTTLTVRLGTLAKEDLDYLLREINEPCPPGTSPEEFLANWQAALGDLEQAGQPISQLMATDILQKCFGPEYTDCWRTFVRLFPLPANRTVLRLCDAITNFARDELPLLGAQMAIGANQVVELQGEVKELRALLAQQTVTMQALAVQRAPLPSHSIRKRGQQQVAALKEPPTKVSIRLTPFANRLFCWTHGPCQHVGEDCDGPPLDARQEAATWRHQAGSKWMELFKRKGWSTVSP